MFQALPRDLSIAIRILNNCQGDYSKKVKDTVYFLKSGDIGHFRFEQNKPSVEGNDLKLTPNILETIKTGHFTKPIEYFLDTHHQYNINNNINIKIHTNDNNVNTSSNTCSNNHPTIANHSPNIVNHNQSNDNLVDSYNNHLNCTYKNNNNTTIQVNINVNGNRESFREEIRLKKRKITLGSADKILNQLLLILEIYSEIGCYIVGICPQITSEEIVDLFCKFKGVSLITTDCVGQPQNLENLNGFSHYKINKDYSVSGKYFIILNNDLEPIALWNSSCDWLKLPTNCTTIGENASFTIDNDEVSPYYLSFVESYNNLCPQPQQTLIPLIETNVDGTVEVEHIIQLPPQPQHKVENLIGNTSEVISGSNTSEIDLNYYNLTNNYIYEYTDESVGYNDAAECKKVYKGIGLHILQNMGYQEGSGLGENGSGVTEPIDCYQRVKNRGIGYLYNDKYSITNINTEIKFQSNIQLEEENERIRKKLKLSSEYIDNFNKNYNTSEKTEPIPPIYIDKNNSINTTKDFNIWLNSK
ncbi:hypothetical protein DLAC_05500 [Tieghemostelium lacteum]|uniref:G-patch domain-containing protein n=1 Tax=Tieghemostelium lacteum TaxID=361077 RepID=A0A151ZG12_TIELA|nr:hypothetical protein DLAC_05500 [Tieghemostelium lacteum]|eukprot:KYQ92908.1 hypothetical protein DLAC_05500 [Tieghemostelium lacteum]